MSQVCTYGHSQDIEIIWDAIVTLSYQHVTIILWIELLKTLASFGLQKVLHDWSDSECIQILKNCREAISKKVIIGEALIDEQNKEDKMTNAKLLMDMVMMAHTNEGKERTQKEWAYVLTKAGFSSYVIKSTSVLQSLIVAIP